MFRAVTYASGRVGVEVLLVPPFPIANTPLMVKVPVAVIGPPLKVSPVVPPEALTLVTVPLVEVAQLGIPPARVRTWPFPPAVRLVGAPLTPP